MKGNKIYNLLFFGGLSRNQYKSIVPLIRDENLKIWRRISIVLSTFFLILFTLTFIVPNYFTFETGSVDNLVMKYQIVYGVLSTFSILITMLLWFVAPKLPKITMALIIFSEIAILGTFASVSPTLGRNSLSVTVVYCALLFASSLITITNPVCNVVITTIAQCIFVPLACIFVNVPAYRDVFIDDIVYSCGFYLLTITLGSYFMYTRISGLNLRYYVEQQRDIDTLTGVKSKTAYDCDVGKIMEKLFANKECEPFAVAVFDVNGLKYTNDHFGHEFGDELLIKASKLIGDYFKTSCIYRVGGDEFVVIVKNEDYQNRDDILTKFQEKIAYINEVAKEMVEDIPVAVGMSAYDPTTDYDFVSIFSRADTLMYKNKKIMKENNRFLKDIKREY